MRPKSLTASLLILSAFVLSGATCKRVQIGDHEICGDKGPYGAQCFQMLSEGKRTLSKDAWDKLRFAQLCMTGDAFANIKAALLKLCEQTQRCTWQEIKDIENLGKNLNTFENQVRRLR